MDRAISIVVATLVVLSGSVVTSQPAQALLGHSPPGEVLIVSNNLYETELKDARNSKDMKNFVARVMEKSPYVPDVLLLQEVRGKSVEKVRRLISEATGERYSTVVDAAEPPWIKLSSRRVQGTDTAILINSTTMEKAGRTGRVKHGYKKRFAAKGTSVKVKRSSYALLREVDVSLSEFLLPVVSLHFPKQREFKSETVSQRLKKKFSRQLTSKLGGLWPGGTYKKVIAGDFNNFRCMSDGKYASGGSKDCDQTPAYNFMTKRAGYKDSIFRMQGYGNPIDFIFTKGQVIDAWWDKQQKSGDVPFYSNHPLMWSLVEPVDTTAPTAPGEISGIAGYGDFIQFSGWKASFDGGSGFDTFEIWRSGPERRASLLGETWELIDTRREHRGWYRDYDVSKGCWYAYKVVPRDHLSLKGIATPTVQDTAGTKEEPVC